MNFYVQINPITKMAVSKVSTVNPFTALPIDTYQTNSDIFNKELEVIYLDNSNNLKITTTSKPSDNHVWDTSINDWKLDNSRVDSLKQQYSNILDINLNSSINKPILVDSILVSPDTSALMLTLQGIMLDNNYITEYVWKDYNNNINKWDTVESYTTWLKLAIGLIAKRNYELKKTTWNSKAYLSSLTDILQVIDYGSTLTVENTTNTNKLLNLFNKGTYGNI